MKIEWDLVLGVLAIFAGYFITATIILFLVVGCSHVIF